MIEAMLLADLLSRVPGEHISSDSTYRLAGRTMRPDLRAYALLIGERHYIHRFYGLDSDSDAAMFPGLRLFAKVLATQVYIDPFTGEAMSALQALKYWSDDLCCRGGSPKNHPYMLIFTYLDRGPCKDGFHAVQLVPMNNVDSPAKRRLGDIIRKPVQEDLDKVVRYLQTRPKNRCSHGR